MSSPAIDGMANLCFVSLAFEGAGRHPDVSFSARAEDYIRRFMEAVEQIKPHASLVPVIDWYISGTSTNKVTGEVRTFGPGIGIGAIDPKN